MIFLNFLDIDQPTFNTSSQNIVSVVEGRYFSVLCKANSSPRISKYTWSTVPQPTLSDTLAFGNIQRSHAGKYTCVASINGFQEKNSSLVINVQCKFSFCSSLLYIFSMWWWAS